MRIPLKNGLILLTAATIWGTAFVAQSVGMDYMGPFTFNGLRYFLGAAVLCPFLLLKRRRDRRAVPVEGNLAGTGKDRKPVPVEGNLPGTGKDRKPVSVEGNLRKTGKGLDQTPGIQTPGIRAPGRANRARLNRSLQGGFFCGLFLCVASNLQQLAILSVDVGKAGFLTAMYIVIVPVLAFFLTGRTSLRLWISVALAGAGLYFLSISGGMRLQAGDLALICCAFVFSLHIMCIDRFSDVDGVLLSCLQFLVAGLLSTGVALVRETITLAGVRAGWFPLVYAGVFSCGIAYTFQILGQKGVDPAVASLILSLESVVSVLAGFVLLGQALSARELFGCVLMFAAIVLVQLPEKALRTAQE